MTREHLLDCLITAVLRPHRNCLKRAAEWHKQSQRYYASTSTSGQINSKLPPSSKTPLRVGLDRNPDNLSAISKLPIPKGEKGENFTPAVLARPLGLRYPPQGGQNTPLDKRTWSEKKRDFQNVENVMERRTKLIRSFFRPYFQDRKYVNYHEGKSFQSNERLFRRDKAFYFPNLWGETLSANGDGPEGGRDTTNVLSGKVSVVAFHGPRWAELQVDTFVNPKTNPELEDIIKKSGGVAQMVNINIQDGIFLQWIVRMFRGRLRKLVPEERWNRYFLVKLAQDTRQGFTEDIRDAMGLLNKNVGYVYLLDTECRIRWAGSGNAWKGETDSLNSGLKRLIQEASVEPKSHNTTLSAKNTSSEPMPEFAIPA